MPRLLRALRHDLWQAAAFARLAAGPWALGRFVADLFLLRVAKLSQRGASGRPRTVRLRGGTEITYRLNRGDLQSIREVWLDEVYRPPFETAPTVLVDLGANIGMTALWLARRYGVATVIAVEPSPENASLTRRNLVGNGVGAVVLEAAVGPTDGTARFLDDDASNIGRLAGLYPGEGASGDATPGREVRVISMATVFASLPEGARVDLLKMDIEGGEGALLDGDLVWLDRVDAVVAEFHPGLIDYERAVGAVQGAGFRFVPPGSVFPKSTDAFVRDSAAVFPTRRG